MQTQDAMVQDSRNVF